MDPCLLTGLERELGMWLAWAVAIAAGGAIWWLLDEKINRRWSLLGDDANKNRLASVGALAAGIATFCLAMVAALNAWRGYFCG